MAQFEEIFSLEDDDCSQLFITQEPKDKIADVLENSSENSYISDGVFLGIAENEFASPCVSLLKPKNDAIYSDISYVEFENNEYSTAIFE